MILPRPSCIGLMNSLATRQGLPLATWIELWEELQVSTDNSRPPTPVSLSSIPTSLSTPPSYLPLYSSFLPPSPLLLPTSLSTPPSYLPLYSFLPPSLLLPLYSCFLPPSLLLSTSLSTPPSYLPLYSSFLPPSLLLSTSLSTPPSLLLLPTSLSTPFYLPLYSSFLPPSLLLLPTSLPSSYACISISSVSPFLSPTPPTAWERVEQGGAGWVHLKDASMLCLNALVGTCVGTFLHSRPIFSYTRLTFPRALIMNSLIGGCG